MNKRRLLHIILFSFTLIVFSCRQSKYVGEGNYLLKKNEVLYAMSDTIEDWNDEHPRINESEVEELIRPIKNSGFKLFIYNRIDTTKYQKQVDRKTNKIKKKNEKRQKKEDRINKKRIKKARKKGKSEYKKKTIAPKPYNYGWRHWVLTHWAEPPVVVDTIKSAKSADQIRIYLNQRGYKNAEVSDSISFNEKKKKATVTYYIEPHEPYEIRNFKLDSTTRYRQVSKLYDRMVKEQGKKVKSGMLLDETKLDDERQRFTKYLKDNAYVGFTKNYISFIVDSTVGNHKADVILFVHDKMIDSVNVLPHKTYKVGAVNFRLHNPDSASFNDFAAYKAKCKSLGISDYYTTKEGYMLLDTMMIIDTVITKRYMTLNPDIRKQHDVGVFEKWVDTSIYYKGTFVYNEKPFIDPNLLDKQNFLELKNYAKDYYIDRSYKSLLRLEVFSRINADMKVTPSDPYGNKVDVIYDLYPADKQQFTIEPRATNTQSILGVSGLISYTNKNVSGKANQLKITLSGGFQSQPLVAGGQQEENNLLKIRGLNTFEWGPEITYSIPKFFPLSKKMQSSISKRSFPSTEIGALYNHQLRSEFDRHVGELNYKWKFSSPDQTQIFTITPLRFDYVFIKKDSIFEANIEATNDPFLINSYSNFLSLGTMNISHHYNNLKKKVSKRKTKHTFDNVVTFTGAGLLINSIDAFFIPGMDYVSAFVLDNKELFKVPYAQFAKVENTFTFNQFITPRHRMVYRFLSGAGYAYANGISLPYTQSFVAGGSNDIRAWDARTMAPGSTKTYADSTSTTTQIGDMKLEFNAEWRFQMTNSLHGALFVDAGNIWKLKGDPTQDVGVFDVNRFMQQIAIGTGFGLRFDLEFLIVRLDFAWKIHNPALPVGNRWWLTADHTEYNTYFEYDDVKNQYIDYIRPHGWRLNFGIGYPF